jgi:hypothetical protein
MEKSSADIGQSGANKKWAETSAAELEQLLEAL